MLYVSKKITGSKKIRRRFLVDQDHKNGKEAIQFVFVSSFSRSNSFVLNFPFIRSFQHPQQHLCITKFAIILFTLQCFRTLILIYSFYIVSIRSTAIIIIVIIIILMFLPNWLFFLQLSLPNSQENEGFFLLKYGYIHSNIIHSLMISEWYTYTYTLQGEKMEWNYLWRKKTRTDKFSSVIPNENFATSFWNIKLCYFFFFLSFHHSRYPKHKYAVEVDRSDYLFYIYAFYHLNYVLFITFLTFKSRVEISTTDSVLVVKGRERKTQIKLRNRMYIWRHTHTWRCLRLLMSKKFHIKCWCGENLCTMSSISFSPLVCMYSVHCVHRLGVTWKTTTTTNMEYQHHISSNSSTKQKKVKAVSWNRLFETHRANME